MLYVYSCAYNFLCSSFLRVDIHSHHLFCSFCWKFNNPCNEGLLVTNSFSLNIHKKFFIFLCFWKKFALYWIQDWYFSFLVFNITALSSFLYCLTKRKRRSSYLYFFAPTGPHHMQGNGKRPMDLKGLWEP